MTQPNFDVGQGGGRGLPIVTLDSGHGGRDPGAVGPTGLLEKDVCLAVSLQARELLRGQVDVRLTRETDVHLPLSRRQAVLGSACLVSIHCNAFTSREANGTETFHMAGRTQDERLAHVLQKHLLARLQLRNRGVKTANFQVTRQARVPAVLVELAFISNPAEEVLLRSVAGQAAAAKAIADGVLEFLNR